MKKFNTRNEVPEKYKWDLSIYFNSDEEVKEFNQKVETNIKELEDYKNNLNNNKKLCEFIEKYSNCKCDVESIYAYSMLMDDQELGKSISAERKNIAINLINRFDVSTAFFVPELLSIEEKLYKELFNYRPLNKYKAYLDKIYRQKAHVLSENEEIIVSELVNSTNNFDDISSLMLNSLHNYGTVKLEDGTIETIATNNLRKLTSNKDEKIRKKVYNSFHKKSDEYSAVNAMLLNNYVKLNTSISKIRKYTSSWDEKLFSINMPNEVFGALIDATEENLDKLQKYYTLKKKISNFKELHLYDMNVEMGKSVTKYTIEESQKILLDSLKPLGSDYVAHFKRIFDEKHIDYCQYKGKCSGAYSMSLANKASRILMSFNEDLTSISTIAHEGGHDVHHQYLSENNDIVYRSCATMVAEVASLTNECLLSNYIVKNSKTKEEKLAGLENIIKVIVSNLYGAVREAKIEQDMYKCVSDGGALTKEYLDSLSYDSYKKYCGNTVQIDKNAKNGWINRSHYYMFFYLYNYAISVSVACNVASKIINGDKKMLDNYIKFLKTGSYSWAIDTFKILGVDLNNKKTYINAIDYFDSLLDEYERIAEKEV